MTWLSVLAYNRGSLCRRLVLPNRIGSWSLTSLQQRLIKTAGRLVKHARYYWLLLAESHLTKAAVWGDGGTDRRLAGGDGVDGCDGRIEIRRPGGEGRQCVREMH
jgi:hypothetical protein